MTECIWQGVIQIFLTVFAQMPLVASEGVHTKIPSMTTLLLFTTTRS